MKESSIFIISLLLLGGVGLAFVPPYIFSFEFVLNFLERCDTLIGVGTFVMVLITALQIRAEKRVREEPVKVFIKTWTNSNKDGKKYPVETRVCKNGVNFRFIRWELTPVFLFDWLKRAFPQLREVDLSFLITENQESFLKIADHGEDLHLVCKNHKIFAKLFACFYDETEKVEEKILEALKEGTEVVITPALMTVLVRPGVLRVYGG